MKWYTWITGWTLAILSFVLAVTSTMTGIFVVGGENEPWGELAGLFYGVSVGGILLSTFTWLCGEEVPDRPDPRLPRAERQKLKKERARLLLERRIEDLEYEVRR